MRRLGNLILGSVLSSAVVFAGCGDEGGEPDGRWRQGWRERDGRTGRTRWSRRNRRGWRCRERGRRWRSWAAPRQQPEVVGLVPAVLAQQPAAAVRQAEARAAQRAQRVPQEPQVRPVAVALAV